MRSLAGRVGGGSLAVAPAPAVAVVRASASEEAEDDVGDGDGEERMLLAGADFRRGGGRVLVLVLGFLELVVDDVAVGRGGLKAGGLRFGIVTLGSGAILIVGGLVEDGDDDGGYPT